MSKKLKVPYVVAMIAKDPVEIMPVVVPAHEVAVLERVHGESKVYINHEADLPNGITDFEFDPDEEYARLEQKYGVHSENKMPYTSMTFGTKQQFGAHVKAVANEVMDDDERDFPQHEQLATQVSVDHPVVKADESKNKGGRPRKAE